MEDRSRLMLLPPDREVDREADSEETAEEELPVDSEDQVNNHFNFLFFYFPSI